MTTTQYAPDNRAVADKIAVITTTQQLQTKKHPNSSVPRKPVQQKYTCLEMGGGSALSPIGSPDRLDQMNSMVHTGHMDTNRGAN
jgi:hypothetical protein